MRIYSTRQVARETKTVFDSAKEEDVIVKRGNDFFQIVKKTKPDTKIVSDEWLDEFFQIPEEFRCNPFDVSPSGDLFFADKRNLDHIDQAKKGKTKVLTEEERKRIFVS